MKNNSYFFLYLCFSLPLLSSFLSCGSCQRGGDKHDNRQQKIQDTVTTYDFYIENSVSMKGFFSGNGTSELEAVINEYYDRLTELCTKDTVTLNFINTKKIPFKYSIDNYLKESKSRCTEKYTKIDDILKESMNDINKNNVNIVVSDFCFDSDGGSLTTAQSHITKLFTEQLNNNENISIAIIKYMTYFDGEYYPGRIKCKKKMPIYFWVFGNAKYVKTILNLNLKFSNCDVLLLQASHTVEPKIIIKSDRAVKNNSIILKHWDPDRHTKKYIVDVIVDMSTTLIKEKDIRDINNYTLYSSSSSKYIIESINKDKESEKYKFTLSTNKPSPGSLEISYNLSLPNWVNKYNYEGIGLPADSTTHGIKYLIGGAFDAFNNKSNKLIKFTINLD